MGREHFGIRILWIYIQMHFYPYMLLKNFQFKQTNFSSIERCVEQKLGILFFSHKYLQLGMYDGWAEIFK